MFAVPAAHPELRILLADVRAQPDADLPRLVLADWLQDQGDPRGELIHLQVVRAGLDQDDPRYIEILRREYQILRRHALDWLGLLADRSSAWEFTRGFISLSGRAANFLVPAVFELASDDLFVWVEGLRLLELRPSHIPALALSSLLARLIRLDLSDTVLGNDGLALLLEAPDVGALHTLRLARAGLGARGAAALADCPHLANLRVLDLRGNRLGHAAVALAESPYLSGLERLEVSGNTLPIAGLAALREAFGDRLVLGTPRSEGS
jgi:uncharacterized protein (TIGR02996 family)